MSLPIHRDSAGDLSAGCKRPGFKPANKVCRPQPVFEANNLADTPGVTVRPPIPLWRGITRAIDCIARAARLENLATERRSQLVPCTEPNGSFSISSPEACNTIDGLVPSTITLSWTSDSAATVLLDGEVVDLNGSRVIDTPSTTTGYALSLQSPCGHASIGVGVAVSICPPGYPGSFSMTYSGCFEEVTFLWDATEDASAFKIETGPSEDGPWSTYAELAGNATEYTAANYFTGAEFVKISVGFLIGGTLYYYSLGSPQQPTPPIVAAPTFVSLTGVGGGVTDSLSLSPFPMLSLVPSPTDGALVSFESSADNPRINSAIPIEIRARYQYTMIPGSWGGMKQIISFTHPNPAAVFRITYDNTSPTHATPRIDVAPDWIDGVAYNIGAYRNGFGRIVRCRADVGGCLSPEIAILVDVNLNVTSVIETIGYNRHISAFCTIPTGETHSVNPPTDCDIAYGGFDNLKETTQLLVCDSTLTGPGSNGHIIRKWTDVEGTGTFGAYNTRTYSIDLWEATVVYMFSRGAYFDNVPASVLTSMTTEWDGPNSGSATVTFANDFTGVGGVTTTVNQTLTDILLPQMNAAICGIDEYDVNLTKVYVLTSLESVS